MFCPKCGKADQTPNSYCRQCGNFLPDFSKKIRKEFGGATPEDQIRTNLHLNLMSACVSLILGVSLIIYYWNQDVSPLLHITAAFLLAMSGWQISTFLIGLKLRKNFNKSRTVNAEENSTQKFVEAKTNELLPKGNPGEFIPPSAVENTTKLLDKIPRE